MAVWTPFLIVYIAGIATPILVVRQILRKQEDGGACLLDAILGLLTILVVMVVWLGLR